MSFMDYLGFDRSAGLYASTPDDEFLNHSWQDKHSIIRIEQLESVLGDAAPASIVREIRNGLEKVGMSIRLNPYMMDLIDWRNAATDPIRRQFLPMLSELEPDHPCMSVDSLEERNMSPAPNLVHRYPDKVLFLVTSVCPVYCQYCTRSYAVGQDTPSLRKDNVTSASGWTAALDYIRGNPTIEDVVISGGDVARLKSQHIKALGNALLDIEHVRRIRFATKSVSVQPMKFLSDEAWFSALVDVAQRGRQMFKSVFVHTHFNHPREVTPLVEKAMRRLFSEGIFVRNQSVLLRGVNDDPKTLIELIRKLGRVNIQPYYVYSCDMVLGTEHFRVRVAEMQRLEREVRGATAGFNTPLFIVDAPGGGGKRDVHSYEYRNDKYGISGYRSPSVDPNRIFYHFDPLRELDTDARADWRAPGGRDAILYRLGLLKPASVAAE
jgi:lysine 2,3-aminomutase